jgi:hypothetical protein
MGVSSTSVAGVFFRTTMGYVMYFLEVGWAGGRTNMLPLD